ncbi:hypothetical protein H671_6g15552 [Cricetulus griseus]|nr:hypothetical protein H671_6g15552 [Cricetulus griseus]
MEQRDHEEETPQRAFSHSRCQPEEDAMACRNSKSSAASWSIREILKLTREKNKTVVISSSPQGQIQPFGLVSQAFRAHGSGQLYNGVYSPL